LNNINDLKDDDFTESMQGNEEGEMCIPCTIKDVNDGDFPGTANTMVTHSQNTNDIGCDSFFLFIFFTQHTI